MTAPSTLEDYRRICPGPNARVGGVRPHEQGTMPLISVVTAVRNRRETLPRTLDSVLGQRLKDVEHIVVDGASTDGTLDVLKQYDDRIAYWVSEPDGGLFDAMNRGIALARGQYISILNSDDWYDANALSAVANAISATKADVVFGDYMFVVQDIAMQKRIVATTELHTGMSLGHAIFISRGVYERLGVYDTRYRYSADLDFALRMKNDGVKFAHVESAAPLQYFSSGGTAETHLFRASMEASSVLRRRAGLWPGMVYGFKGMRRVLSRGMLGLYGMVLGEAAFRRAKTQYYTRAGYVSS
jgi:GT2 family glycosyltransferase